MGALGLVGGVVGGLGGAIGNFIQAREQEKALSRQRREIRRTFKRGRQEFEQARQRFLDEGLIQQGLQFLGGAFSDPLGGGFGEEFQNRFRAAQAARGFGSGGGGSGLAQEASFLTRLADQRRQQLIPLLGTFFQQAEGIGQGAFNRRAQQASVIAGLPAGGANPFAAGLAGSFTGFAGGVDAIAGLTGRRTSTTGNPFSTL